MEDPYITTADVTQQIKKIKEKKSAGPDGIKPDLLKILGNDTHCINILIDSMNKIIPKENSILVYFKYRINTPKKETDSKRSATNSTNKCNVQIIYGSSQNKNLIPYQIHQRRK